MNQERFRELKKAAFLMYLYDNAEDFCFPADIDRYFEPGEITKTSLDHYIDVFDSITLPLNGMSIMTQYKHALDLLMSYEDKKFLIKKLKDLNPSFRTSTEMYNKLNKMIINETPKHLVVYTYLIWKNWKSLCTKYISVGNYLANIYDHGPKNIILFKGSKEQTRQLVKDWLDEPCRCFRSYYTYDHIFDEVMQWVAQVELKRREAEAKRQKAEKEFERRQEAEHQRLLDRHNAIMEAQKIIHSTYIESDLDQNKCLRSIKRCIWLHYIMHICEIPADKIAECLDMYINAWEIPNQARVGSNRVNILNSKNPSQIMKTLDGSIILDTNMAIVADFHILEIAHKIGIGVKGFLTANNSELEKILKMSAYNDISILKDIQTAMSIDFLESDEFNRFKKECLDIANQKKITIKLWR